MPPGKTIIHSTNDPSDINKECRATLSVVGDAALVIEALIAEVEKQKGAARGGNALASLKEEIASVKKAWLAEWAKHLDSDETPINQYRVIRDLMRTMDRDNVIITHDSGSPREQLLPFWETTKAGSYMGWGKSTQLGYGLGITIGAKLAEPKKLCVNVMGDASFGMTGMDIETASRNKIAILTIVFNNGVMGAERDVLPISDKKYGTMTVGGNYTKVAEGLNVPAMRVEKPANIVGAIKEAVTATEKGSPFLLEFMVKEGHDFSRSSQIQSLPCHCRVDGHCCGVDLHRLELAAGEPGLLGERHGGVDAEFGADAVLPDADIFVPARARHHDEVLRSLHAGGQRIFHVGRIADVDVVVDHDHQVEVLQRAERGQDGVALQAVVGRVRFSSPARWRGNDAGRPPSFPRR